MSFTRLYWNKNAFWKVWNSHFNINGKLKLLEGDQNEFHSAIRFADYYSKLCMPNTESKQTEFKNEFSNLFSKYTAAHDIDDNLFNAELVENIILKLENHKSAGIDWLTAEHIKYSHPVVVSILCNYLSYFCCQDIYLSIYRN